MRSALASLGSQALIWKAVAVNADIEQEKVNIPANVDRVLFDSKSHQTGELQFGGTGLTFNWQQSLPNKHSSMLAGGLTAALATLASSQGFYGLDFNSGLESAPGIKDHQEINALFSALRQY